MAQVLAAGIPHEVECFGDRDDPAIVLIHGLGAQLTMWSEAAFCRPLADAGFFVIRYDARDSGLSHQFDELGDPDILGMMAARAAGQPMPPPPYPASALADDVAALLDAVGLEAAHLVGFSMGGVIAQLVALQHRRRVASLTLMATNSGDPTQPQASERVAAKFMVIPTDFYDKDQIVAKSLGIMEVLQGSQYRVDPAVARERIAANFDRWHSPPAVHRLTAAIMTQSNRTPALRTLDVPTLVLHGADDEMVPPANGQQLADVIPGARLKVIPGMGHMLPEGVCLHILPDIIGHLRNAA